MKTNTDSEISFARTYFNKKIALGDLSFLEDQGKLDAFKSALENTDIHDETLGISIVFSYITAEARGRFKTNRRQSKFQRTNSNKMVSLRKDQAMALSAISESSKESKGAVTERIIELGIQAIDEDETYVISFSERSFLRIVSSLEETRNLKLATQFSSEKEADRFAKEYIGEAKDWAVKCVQGYAIIKV